MTLVGIALLAVICVAPAQAVDGVIEINQAKIIASGGFPYHITSPGSYRLTSNIDVTGEATPQDVTAIRIDSSFVTLDLNGFSIIGPVTCSGGGATLVCSTTGAGRGIQVISGSTTGLTIKNGVVKGMGNIGLDMNLGVTRVENVHAVFNGSIGISIGSGLVTGSLADRNHSVGISIGAGTAQGNMVRGNFSYGITALESTGALVAGNHVLSNGGFGLFMGAQTGFVNNTIISNNGGPAAVQVSGGVPLGLNLCDHIGGATTVCP